MILRMVYQLIDLTELFLLNEQTINDVICYYRRESGHQGNAKVKDNRL